MSDFSGEAAGIIGACVAGAVAVGGGVKWLFATRDARQKMVDAAVKEHFGELNAKVVLLEGRVALLTNGCTILMGEVARHVPDSPVLREANRLFNLAFEVPAALPDSLADLIDELRAKEARAA